MLHSNLGAILCDIKRDYDGAIACFKKAIALDPTLALAHYNLGNARRTKGEVDEAIACYHKAIALDPTLALAHNGLGVALQAKGEVDEAIACFQKAIALDPKYAQARAHLAKSKRLTAIRDKLAAFQKGTWKPATASERIELATWCQVKKLHHTAAGLFAAAFAAEARLANDLNAGHRYNAARCAALAATGQGEDAAKLIDKERTRLRQQALAWLRADLGLWARQFAAGEVTRRRLTRALKFWQQDGDLAGLRDAAALAKRPKEEHKACTQLWADVATLLKKTEQKPN
jgi:tetratricopeptide (TPR) repeat protein